MKKSKSFNLTIEEDYYKKGDIIRTISTSLIVLETPKHSKFRKFLSKITFGLVSVTYYYKVKNT